MLTGKSCTDSVTAPSHHCFLRSTYLGTVRWYSHSLRICLFSVRLACPRKGNLARFNPLQLDCVEGSPLSWSLSTTCRVRPRVSVSIAVHNSGVPHQDGIYYLLAGSILVGWRSPCSCVSRLDSEYRFLNMLTITQSVKTKSLPTRPVYSSLYHCGNPIDCVLLIDPSADVRGQV